MNIIANVKMIETQQESEIDNEILFTLLVNGKNVSWAHRARLRRSIRVSLILIVKN
jgi:hypothetical protein